MKILYISNAIIPTEMSRSLSIMRVCQAFADEGHEVTLCAVAAQKDHQDPLAYYGLKGGFNVITTHLNNFIKNKIFHSLLITGLLHGNKIKKVTRNFNPELVYSRLTVLELFFLPNNLPVIYEMHSLGPLGRRWWQKLALKYIFKKKNIVRIIVTTEILKQWLEKELPEIDIKIARLSAELPIELEKPAIEKFKKDSIEGSFDNNIGYTGYLDTYGLRGTDIICKTAARFPEAGFHIVGGEPDVVSYWKEYALKYNKFNNIFIYGYRNPTEMPYFLNSFDIVLAPLQFMPAKRAKLGQNMSPLKIPQYMSYKKAIIASDLNSHREYINDQDTGLLVKYDDLDCWEQAIKSLLASESLRNSLGNRAGAEYRTQYTPSQRISKILENIVPRNYR